MPGSGAQCATPPNDRSQAALSAAYMLRRYWPPTSYSALLIWPSEQ